MRFYTASKLGPKRALTPEGFLVCEDVPIARTGEMIYAAAELPGLIPGRDGLIRVQRDPEEVFKPESMASFLGKPTTNNHPPVPVTPANYRTYAAGSAMNIRRGEGEQADLMIADLLFCEPDAIKAIQDGKDEISNGYDADYEQISPGVARQVGIVGNHVALVDEGRCGERCAIGDSAAALQTTPAADIVLAKDDAAPPCGCGGRHHQDPPAISERTPYMAKVKKSAFDRLRAAFATKDEKAFEEEVSKVQDDVEELQEASQQSAAEKKLADMISQAVTTGVKPLGDRIDAIEAKMVAPTSAVAPVATADDPDEALKAFLKSKGLSDEDIAAACAITVDDAPSDMGVGEMPNDLGGGPENQGGGPTNSGSGVDDSKMTADSAGLAGEFQDTVARAEIIAPGVKLPTYDGKSKKKTVADSICALRRTALAQAYASNDRKAHVAPFVTDATPDFGKMTCDAIKMVFTGASELAKAANNRQPARTTDAPSRDASIRTSISDWNKANREFWTLKK